MDRLSTFELIALMLRCVIGTRHFGLDATEDRRISSVTWLENDFVRLLAEVEEFTNHGLRSNDFIPLYERNN